MVKSMQHKKTTPLRYLFDESFRQISPLGSHQFFIIVTALYLLTYKLHEFKTLILGLILISAIAIPIRIVFYRQRPDKTGYHNLIEKVHAASFPSLHSTRATFLTLFLVIYFEKQLLVSLFIAAIGILVIYGRLYRKRHYPLDIIAGIILGTMVYAVTLIML